MLKEELNCNVSVMFMSSEGNVNFDLQLMIVMRQKKKTHHHMLRLIFRTKHSFSLFSLRAPFWVSLDDFHMLYYFPNLIIQ